MSCALPTWISRGAARSLLAFPLLLALAHFTAPEERLAPRDVLLRVSFAGHLPRDVKLAVALSRTPLRGFFELRDRETRRTIFRAKLPAPTGPWGAFPHHYELDFSAVKQPGRYEVVLARTGKASSAFEIAGGRFAGFPDLLLEFMRQQRCGYNQFLDAVCHPYDGRTAYGPLRPGSYLDARGGWHDAGDQLKYLLTSSAATAHLLMAYREAPAFFADAVDDLGRPSPNGLPDVLDEARWGLEWMLRLHPGPDQLYHQVADDRDHIGWKLPQADTSDYGWGPGRERVVYFADGRSQGLGGYRSESDGIANLAGRYAAAMALAHQVWKNDARYRRFGHACLTAGIEVYRLGREREGVQQGNSFGAPYRYAEATWADDMEWGAAELYRATGERAYLADAERYASLVQATSWMGREEAGHYQLYPFVNLGHFVLHAVASEPLRGTLAGYYREGLEASRHRAARHPYGMGVPFIWCSNNLVVALVTQGLLYERMTGDTRYGRLVTSHRDWLLGRNPWGTSMFTGVPEGFPSPSRPHLSTTHLTGQPVRGGLVDGPVRASIFRGLKGVTLSETDPLAAFQAEDAVYHDDVGDYATNEPTMDGTASAILMFALLAG